MATSNAVNREDPRGGNRQGEEEEMERGMEGERPSADRGPHRPPGEAAQQRRRRGRRVGRIGGLFNARTGLRRLEFVRFLVVFILCFMFHMYQWLKSELGDKLRRSLETLERALRAVKAEELLLIADNLAFKVVSAVDQLVDYVVRWLDHLVPDWFKAKAYGIVTQAPRVVHRVVHELIVSLQEEGMGKTAKAYYDKLETMMIDATRSIPLGRKAARYVVPTTRLTLESYNRVLFVLKAVPALMPLPIMQRVIQQLPFIPTRRVTSALNERVRRIVEPEREG
ncbi:hypothetical protein CBR_g18704 [Chara braunii]|uniref:Uncharacterized protein n=1 Tax=Chara braunii TaxID=69332 RepID=A0A388KWG2_CHABU|nr:hypothetical protein CBR_g18704 [Chara braunii]|eukprot:GBG74293.1 hypothetical protein CBR_g18704 [Chara braunii]